METMKAVQIGYLVLTLTREMERVAEERDQARHLLCEWMNHLTDPVALEGIQAQARAFLQHVDTVEPPCAVCGGPPGRGCLQ